MQVSIRNIVAWKMKKALAIIVLGLLLSSNANAAKGDGVCGLQSNLDKMELL